MVIGLSKSRPPSSNRAEQAHQKIAQRVGEAAQRLLTPLARLLIAHGLKFNDAEELLKKAFLEAGRLELERSEMPVNTSRLSITTGLHRMDIKRIAELPEPGRASGNITSTSRSLAAQIYTRWITDKRLSENGKPKPLPIRSTARRTSFETLARRVNTDAHPRSILEELKRLGLATEDSERGIVHLRAGGFVPLLKQTELLKLLGDNVTDHLDTAVKNVVESGHTRLEQAVYADGLSAASVEVAERLSRQLWQQTMRKLVPTLVKLEKADAAKGLAESYRWRLGMYVYDNSPGKESRQTAPTVLKSQSTGKSPKPK